MAVTRLHKTRTTKDTLLSRARMRRGLSLGDMAAVVGCEKGNLSRIMRGEVKPGLELTKRIVDCLGEDLITRDEVLFPELYPLKKPARRSRQAELQEAS